MKKYRKTAFRFFLSDFMTEIKAKSAKACRKKKTVFIWHRNDHSLFTRRSEYRRGIYILSLNLSAEMPGTLYSNFNDIIFGTAKMLQIAPKCEKEKHCIKFRNDV